MKQFVACRVKNGPDGPECLFRSAPINGHYQIGPAGPFRARFGSRCSHLIT
jgi:hypothetical protein